MKTEGKKTEMSLTCAAAEAADAFTRRDHRAECATCAAAYVAPRVVGVAGPRFVVDNSAAGRYRRILRAQAASRAGVSLADQINGEVR